MKRVESKQRGVTLSKKITFSEKKLQLWELWWGLSCLVFMQKDKNHKDKGICAAMKIAAACSFAYKKITLRSLLRSTRRAFSF